MEPRPSPPILAAVATKVLMRLARSGASSRTATVAVPVKMPAETPETARARRIAVSPSACQKRRSLTSEARRPARSIGRRPSWSDQRPTPISAAMTPKA